ncbi:unnamed protein product [Arctogadus glacialis]
MHQQEGAWIARAHSLSVSLSLIQLQKMMSFVTLNTLIEDANTRTPPPPPPSGGPPGVPIKASPPLDPSLSLARSLSRARSLSLAPHAEKSDSLFFCWLFRYGCVPLKNPPPPPPPPLTKY